MRYSEEFKNQVIEDFKSCPFYKTISAKYNLERGTLKTWVRKKCLDVPSLIDEYESNEVTNKIALSKFIKISIIEGGKKVND